MTYLALKIRTGLIVSGLALLLANCSREPTNGEEKTARKDAASANTRDATACSGNNEVSEEQTQAYLDQLPPDLVAQLRNQYGFSDAQISQAYAQYMQQQQQQPQPIPNMFSGQDQSNDFMSNFAPFIPFIMQIAQKGFESDGGTKLALADESEAGCQ